MSSSDWRKEPNATKSIMLKYVSDLNNAISNSISITAKHFTGEDINTFPANYNRIISDNYPIVYNYDLYDIGKLNINLIDSTNIYGGAKFSIYIADKYNSVIKYNSDTNIISYNGKYDVDFATSVDTIQLQITSSLTNDYCVNKYFTINLTLYNAIEFELISPYSYNRDAVNLPLISIANKISDNIIEFNPLSYPIVFIIPNTIKNISTNKVGQLILNIARVDIYTNDETYSAYFDKNCTLTSTSIEIDSSNIGDFDNKLGSTSNLILGDTHIYVNSPKLINILDCKSLDDNAYNDSSDVYRYNSITMRMFFELSYYSNATNEHKTNSFAIDYIPVLGLVSKLSSGNLQGEHFTVDSVKSDFTSILFAIDAIRHNYKYSNDRIIADLNKNVGLLGNSSKYINKNSYISGKNNKEIIESALVDLNALIDVINKDRGYSKISKVRQNIAIGEYIMWDDSLDILADGSNNTFKNSEKYLNSTASPYMELFNGLRTIQYGIETLVSYRNNEDNLIFYKNDSNEEFAIAVKF